MLRGSIVHDYSYDYDGDSFSDLCLRRMDGDRGPWDLALYVLARALAGLAWLTLVLGMRWQLRTKAVAALPGLATLALAGAEATGDAVRGQDGEVLLILVVGIELSAVVALVAISALATRRWRSPLAAPDGGAVGYDGLWFHPRGD
jgi:hypothetical protein